MADKLYEILIEAKKEGKTIICNATEDTSLINIKQLVEKGLAEIYDLEGQKIVLKDGKRLEYETGEDVNFRDFGYSTGIEMLDIEIRPNMKKIKEERKKIEDILEKARRLERMRGKKKEEEIEELRKKIKNGVTKE